MRTRLGLKQGAVIEFAAEGGRLVGRKATTEGPVDSVWGILDLGEPVDDHVERLRGRSIGLISADYGCWSPHAD